MNALSPMSDLAAYLEALADPTVAVSPDGIVLGCNMGAAELFGSDIRNQALTLLTRSPAIAQAIRAATLQREKSRVPYDLYTVPPRAFEALVAPVVTNAGVAAVLVTFRDLTREQQIEKMRSDFVANVSHELRTPLATLSGFVETMQGAARNDDKAREEFLKIMKSQASRMSRLIEDLLSLSRIETNEHVAPTSEVDLTQVVRQTVELLNSVAKNAGCELQTSFSGPVMVMGDAGELAQVAHNLIENAIKYSGEGKRVEIAVRRDGDAAVLLVRDNGPGIAAHHVPRLTERFYRVNAQDSRMRGGTGLGLAISKHIVNRHRGKLLIESELGRGSTFSVVLQVSK